jgi:hypothetical protein
MQRRAYPHRKVQEARPVRSEIMTIGVVLERRAIDNPWEDHVWTPVAVLPAADESVEWRLLAEEGGTQRWFAGTLPLELHRKATEGYLYNLANDPPRIFVELREDETGERELAPFAVTACPFEAQSALDSEGSVVEGVTMPEPVRDWVGAFCTAFHVAQPHYKRKRKDWNPQKGGPPPDAPRREPTG